MFLGGLIDELEGVMSHILNFGNLTSIEEVYFQWKLRSSTLKVWSARLVDLDEKTVEQSPLVCRGISSSLK